MSLKRMKTRMIGLVLLVGVLAVLTSAAVLAAQTITANVTETGWRDRLFTLNTGLQAGTVDYYEVIFYTNDYIILRFGAGSGAQMTELAADYFCYNDPNDPNLTTVRQFCYSYDAIHGLGAPLGV